MSSETQPQEVNCENCPLRAKAEARPKSLMGRLWKWHTTWCPGWKAYQEQLASQQGGGAAVG